MTCYNSAQISLSLEPEWNSTGWLFPKHECKFNAKNGVQHKFNFFFHWRTSINRTFTKKILFAASCFLTSIDWFSNTACLFKKQSKWLNVLSQTETRLGKIARKEFEICLEKKDQSTTISSLLGKLKQQVVILIYWKVYTLKSTVFLQFSIS